MGDVGIHGGWKLYETNTEQISKARTTFVGAAVAPLKIGTAANPVTISRSQKAPFPEFDFMPMHV